jgi:rhodanese-related sulfurtransferase
MSAFPHRLLRMLAAAVPLILAPAISHGDRLEVGITSELDRVEVLHRGKPVVIQREQDTFNIVTPDYSMTARACPPYCVQPMSAGPGIETLGELEFLEYLRRVGRDDNVLVIDSRTAGEYARGTIPGAINLPWDRLHFASGAEPLDVQDRLAGFGVVFDGDFYDFSNARTLVLFCNGPWCGQSPTNLRTLVNLGYPAHRLKWYRGGMQLWHLFGLTTVPGEP